MNKKKNKYICPSNPVGRPPAIDDNTLRKLEDAFSLGATDNEACFQAGIGKSTLYKYQNEHPEYVERKNQLKEKMIFKARAVIENALNEGDKDTAKWYLERKKKDEFGTRTEITGADGGAIATYDLSKLDKQTLLEMADRAGVTDDTAEQS